MDINYIEKLVQNVGVVTVKKATGVDARAIRRWVENGKMPRTEYSGETCYTEAILKIPNCCVTFSQLMPIPKPLKKRWRVIPKAATA